MVGFILNNDITLITNYAAIMHEGQFRIDKMTPFFVHPFRTALLVKHYNGDAVQVAIALLHDIVEDCPIKFSDIEVLLNRTSFTDEGKKKIINALIAITKPERPNVKREVRVSDYATQFCCNGDALTVKICDTLDNLSDLNGVNPKFIREKILPEYSLYVEKIESVGKLFVKENEKKLNDLKNKLDELKNKYGDINE